MDGELTRKVVFANGDWTTKDVEYVRWDVDPVFEFASEAEALMTLEYMANDYRAALEQAQHTMRYLKAAIAGSQELPVEKRPRPQGIINHTRLARQTVYDALATALREE